ncbi:MAG: FCD domain-containing protein [Acidobacteria bacterium]|nr:FCD domain-containing protein [Acidobacteriota bacterium]
MDTIAHLLYQMRREFISQASDFHEAIAWHEKIYEALKKRDPKRAKEVMTGHLRAALAGWKRDHQAERPKQNGAR